MKKKFKKAFGGGAGILLAGLVAIASTAISLPAKAAGSGYAGLNVTYHTQQEILDRMNSDAAVTDVPLSFLEAPATTEPYAAGSLTTATLNGAVAMLNQIRYIAGLQDNVTLNDSYNQYAQAASLVDYVDYANGQLYDPHHPTQPTGMADELYKLGYEGAGKSNLAQAWSSSGTVQPLKESIVNGWMADEDESNIGRVGHRRWCLNPTMGQTGFGAVWGSAGTWSAMYAFDTSNSTAAETAVAWPAQNMPIEYFDATYPWSVSMGSTVDMASVTVTLTRVSDSRTWTFSSQSADGYFTVENGNYGQTGCIIFLPSDISFSAGDSFRVTIDGLSTPIAYTVNFFDESTCGSNENPGNTPGESNPGDNTPSESNPDNTPGESNPGSTPSESNPGSTPGESNTGDNTPGESNTGDNTPGESNTSHNTPSYTPSVSDAEMMITDAKSGDTIRLTGVTTLSNGEMKQLLNKVDVTLIMEYTYEGKDYVITIPSNAAMDNDIPWYGPLYLSAHYGNGTSVNGTTGTTGSTGSTYTVQPKDTMTRIARMNGMTLSQLASKNPQIKDLNKIYVGQRINLK